MVSMHQEESTKDDKFNDETGRIHLNRVDELIQKLETQHSRDSSGSPPLTSACNFTDFWKRMSPQLSYIDGSSLSSKAPSFDKVLNDFSVETDTRCHSPNSVDFLEWKLDIREDTPAPSLPSLNEPLSLDSSCNSKSFRRAALIARSEKSSPYASKPKINFPPILCKPSISQSPRISSRPQSALSKSKSPKSKIQKRLSFANLSQNDSDKLDNKLSPHKSISMTLSSFGDKAGSGSSSDGNDRLVRRNSFDTQSQCSLYMEKDLRYYFQHPWFRLVVAYLVIFCNFLLFVEDPVSHSHAESRIPVVGNVFSFVVTKYPVEWYWKLIKVIMWLIAIMCGMLVGKVLIHGVVLKRVLRLKMFRDDQGSWMSMVLTVVVSLYMFSHVYNLVLLIGHRRYWRWQIDSSMWITNENMMKAAATCTWLGDLITALMVTDMMLQDNMYPHWGTKFRRLYRLSNVPRILIFWVGSIVVAVVVIFLIVSDYISWDGLNKGFVETTELSRAFLASFILVMDLLIVMQDWDFPHFTSTIDVNLPGFYTHTLHWRYAETKITGKWFNYGIIFIVLIFDLNMWKNQIFYSPEDYGQYIDPVSRKVFTVEDETIFVNGTSSMWTWEARGVIDPDTGIPFRDNDMFMYSRYMGYPLPVKCTAFIPSFLGFVMFFTLITLYGRFPPNKDGTYGGRLKKRKRSSWRRERRFPLLRKRLNNGTSASHASSTPNNNHNATSSSPKISDFDANATTNV